MRNEWKTPTSGPCVQRAPRLDVEVKMWGVKRRGWEGGGVGDQIVEIRGKDTERLLTPREEEEQEEEEGVIESRERGGRRESSI